ncbi:hypothetical protein STIAU_1911, partial [Stigmatella aurantiaca DW4/3-1]
MIGLIHCHQESVQTRGQPVRSAKATPKLSFEQLVVAHDSEKAVMVMVWLWSSHRG